MATANRPVENPLGYQVIFYEDAKNDILEIARWYDLQMEGLGNRFEKYLHEAIQKLTTHPFAFGWLFEEVRKIKLHVFPYIIFYEIKHSDVHVYGVIHTKRKPAAYKKRLRKLR